MFGLWKYYERQFTAFEDGYTIQTRNGLKFVRPAERELLINSYRKAMAFDIKRILFGVLVMIAVIIAAAVPAVLFDLPAIVMDIAAYAVSLGVVLVVCKPWWDHYQLSRRLYVQARTLPQTKSSLQRFGDYLYGFSWIRIAFGLLIYGFILYRLILNFSVEPLQFWPTFFSVALVAGIALFLLAAIWKLIGSKSQAD